MRYIYLIKAEKEDVVHYKIGIAKNINKRIKELQTGNPMKLVLINQFESEFPTLVEKTLHRKFNLLHENGEWFNLEQKDVDDFIINCQKLEKDFKYLSENNSLW